jgi:hypothetical protein
MGKITYEKLRKHVSEELNPRIREFSKTVEEICRNFKALGLETAVWYPEKIYTSNVGGIDADCYVGYSRIEGRWGLMIRMIERDHECRSFVNQRVITLESCGNMEIVAGALKKVRDLVLMIQAAADQQISTLAQSGPEITELGKPDCAF